MSIILSILEALKEAGIAGPGDIVIATGKPRYLVLSTLKILEELGFVEAVYSRGTHRIYRVSALGLLVLEAGLKGLRDAVEAGLKVISEEGPEEVNSDYSKAAPSLQAGEAVEEV